MTQGMRLCVFLLAIPTLCNAVLSPGKHVCERFAGTHTVKTTISRSCLKTEEIPGCVGNPCVRVTTAVCLSTQSKVVPRSANIKYCCEGYVNNGDDTCVPVGSIGPFYCRRCEHGCGPEGRCQCQAGYRLVDGFMCIDVDECGEDVSDKGPCGDLCTNSDGGYYCECIVGRRLVDDGHHCEQINECLVNNGQCEQRCIDTVEGRFCACYPGYEVFELFQCKLADCRDLLAGCPGWAADGLCTNDTVVNPIYMTTYCTKSCGACLIAPAVSPSTTTTTPSTTTTTPSTTTTTPPATTTTTHSTTTITSTTTTTRTTAVVGAVSPSSHAKPSKNETTHREEDTANGTLWKKTPTTTTKPSDGGRPNIQRSRDTSTNTDRMDPGPLVLVILAPIVGVIVSVLFVVVVVYCLRRRDAAKSAASAPKAYFIDTSRKPLAAQLTIKVSQPGDAKTTAFDNQIYQELPFSSALPK